MDNGREQSAAALDGIASAATPQAMLGGNNTMEPTPVDVNRHPVGLWFFFWGEFAERSSYYGMRAILPLYLTTVLHFAATTATPIYSGFKMACYFLPLVGGFIADRWLGRYWTIVGFSVPYVLGHFILGIESQIALFIALALLAGGSGVIKPNISALMGQTYDQQRPGKEQLRSAAFQWFYLSINIGSFISMLAVPLVRNQFGYAIAFQFPAWLMVLSLAVFAAGKPHYAKETFDRHELTPEERKLQRQTLARLFGIFALVVLFWAGYEQNDNLWIYFTRDYVDLHVPGLADPIKPDQLQFLNALFVVILIPTFTFLFGRYDPHLKIFTPMRKILAGFVLTAASIAIMAMASFLAQGHTKHELDLSSLDASTIVSAMGYAGSGPSLWQVGMANLKVVEVSTVKVSLLWPTMAIIVLTVGEVLLYGTMLELAYTAAPKSMKGLITACFLLTNTFGNFINGGLSTLYGGSLADPIDKRGPLMPGTFFAITTAMVVAAAIAFVFIGKRFEHAQKEQAEAGLA